MSNMSYNTLDVELSDPSAIDQPQLLKNQGGTAWRRLKTVLFFSLAATIACGGFFMGGAIVSEGEATVSEGEATSIFSKQGVVSTSSKKKKRGKGTSPACDVYYVDPVDVQANTRLVDTQAIGTVQGNGCLDFGGFLVCTGSQLITLPIPFYTDASLTYLAGMYQDHGTVINVLQPGEGSDVTISKNLVLIFEDGSEIFGIEEASLVDEDIFVGITTGVGRYFGASGYIELISDDSVLEIDVCVH